MATLVKQTTGQVCFNLHNFLHLLLNLFFFVTAKAGLIGFAKSLAKEGEKYNVFTNVIAPNAGTRMTETVLPSDIVEALKPEFCVPPVLYLASEECQENGGTFETGGGWTAKVKYFRTEGAVLPPNQRSSPEALRDRWDEVADFSKSELHATDSAMETAEHVVNVAKSVVESSQRGSKTLSTWKDAVGMSLPTIKFEYCPDRTILYALGIGCSQTNPKDMQYIYEGHDNFAAFPTFGVIPAQDCLFQLEGIPDIPVDLSRLLHGESYLELIKPFPKNGKLITKAKVADIVDKKSGALFVLDAITTDAESGDHIAYNQFVVFVKGAGGFGGPRQSDKQRAMPVMNESERNRSPDAERLEQIPMDQNAIYRLSGDKNPMHIDKNFSMLGGFDKPILHGLCSLGIATRHVVDTFSNAKFESVKVRFSKPVLPGQNVRTKMWKRKVEGDKFMVLYQTVVEETGDVALSGCVTMNGSDVPNKQLAKL